MGMYKFMMSCGHEDTREVADPTKYFNIDKEYYRKQGLCDECWKQIANELGSNENCVKQIYSRHFRKKTGP